MSDFQLKNLTPEEEQNEQKREGFYDLAKQGNSPRPLSLGKFFIIPTALLILLLLTIAIPGFFAYKSATGLIASVKSIKTAVDSQNLEQIKTSLSQGKKDTKAFENSLILLSWVRPIPLLGGYVSDAVHASKATFAGLEAAELLVDAVGPYADILGFNGGQEAQDGAKTAEDRINFIVETIEEIIPKLDPIAEKTNIMAQEVKKINPGRYPEHFQGRKLREQIKNGIDLVEQANRWVTDGKPVLRQIPYLLGISSERTYLLLWQNDKEIRPTGGFITAYSIMKVSKGKVEPVSSNDIYNLDNRFKSRIPAPEPIKKYLPLVPYWNLRDMNLSADFKVSMDTFFENYAKIASVDKIDGIISVDTYPLVELLRVMGRIGVPGFGNFSADNDPRCNCPVAIYELESYADVAGPIVWDDISGKIVYKPPHADNRKAILGPLMNSILANALGQPKEKLPELLQVAWNSLNEKHVLFYFKDEITQKDLELGNFAGRIKDFEGDYLHINDTNFAGAKSNLYVEQEVGLKVSGEKGGSRNMLTIKYKNPQKHDGWLNGPFRDWVRVYVPKGSQLLDSKGSEVPVETKEEFGKTYFEGFFTLRPEGVVELTFEYKTPVSTKGDYQLLVQKQPGTGGNMYVVDVNGQKEEFHLTQDRQLNF